MGRGGSEACALWGIQALVEAFQVSLLTPWRVDLDRLNAFYGTSLRAGEFEVRRAAMPAPLRRRGAALRAALFQRFCRSVAYEFDLLVSAYNPLDFGVPAIHFVADFCWDRVLREELDPMPGHAQASVHRSGWLREVYLALGRRLGRPSGRNLFAGEDLMVANSGFTADLLRDRFGLADVPVVHPPVAGEVRHIAFAEREAGFVCLGRISHEKRIERIVEILAQVRRLGHDVHLHVVGPVDPTPYGGFVRRLLHENRAWVFAEGEQAGAAKWALLARHRYAIHARPFEAFGIAVAEMAKAGCVTFVPACGGPAEIVGDERLCYRDSEDAVRKVDRVLRDESLARELSKDLAARAARFSAERFMAEFRAVVERFAAARRAGE